MRKIVLASRNEGKLRELKALLSPLGWEVVPLTSYPDLPEIEETGETFAANALAKARTVASLTGEVALADDSGLEVDYLGGAPGVRSARFAGRQGDDVANIALLLKLLEGVPWEKRKARFRCVIAVVTPEGREYLAEGTVEGYILEEPRGREGFGYDPVFFLPEYGRTFAELPLEVKNQISHRARALAKIKEILRSL
ncbi:XTP/dITP diphosphatase [Ammonifex thiophilus]|uniref:dITP/XTP pyrophosphatase n=1 Tax=Ammonifex thiophilus TaxID=444093 RepID=A0A3D8P7R9_9THEO|nr:XTP/dITP diphosphatase [Ammonifex thiophilus]RDV84747.1 XTP/dITP diphosphatase [Ammonifex thiophilus]